MKIFQIKNKRSMFLKVKNEKIKSITSKEHQYVSILSVSNKLFSYLIWPETWRDPRVLFEGASAVIVALRMPLMMHQGLLKGEARRSRLHRTFEGFLMRRTGGPTLESHGHGHRRTRTEAESRGTTRLRRSPLMFLPGTPAASAHLSEIRILN